MIQPKRLFFERLLMPISAKRPCSHSGCRELVQGSGLCSQHKSVTRKRYDDSRGNSNSRGYTSAWRRARGFYLLKHPLCVRHERMGEMIQATVVDHIKPHKGNKELFWDSSNWQSLCKPCHDSWKQQLEKSGNQAQYDAKAS